MTLERGFQRALIVISIALLSLATLFAGFLAWSWSLQVSSEAQQKTQREARLSEKGCRREDPGPPIIGVSSLSPRRWRVMLWSRFSLSDADLRPLLVAPGFRSAYHEERRILIAASDRDFANASRAGQDT